jgi:hypothetical protein
VPQLFAVTSDSGSLIQAGGEHRLVDSLIGRSCFKVRIKKAPLSGLFATQAI